MINAAFLPHTHPPRHRFFLWGVQAGGQNGYDASVDTSEKTALNTP